MDIFAGSTFKGLARVFIIVENNELIIHIEKALMAANKIEEVKERMTIIQYGFMYLSTFKYSFMEEMDHPLFLLV